MSQMTIEQLQAMQQQVQQGYALIEHPRFVEAETVLATLAESEAVARISQLASELPDSGAKGALNNVAAAIASARGLLQHETPRVAALLPSPPPPPPAPPPSPPLAPPAA